MLKARPLLFSIACMFFEKAKLYWTETFPLSFVVLDFPSCVPFKLPTPNILPSAFIYKLPLVGSLWWEGGFPCWWVPLGYIPNQMRPISHDWYDFLETCNFRQMVLDKRFFTRHYRSPLFKPRCDIGPQPYNLMKSDGLGPDFTLGLVHITLRRLNDRPQHDAHTSKKINV